MDRENITPQTARNETEIFDELQRLCCSPGYAHAIAYFCWRDNLIRYSGDLITEKDMQHLYSHDRLSTIEISTLVGLMAKGKIDVDIPQPQVIQTYISQSEILLFEMHMSLQKPWAAAFEAMVRDPRESTRIDPFSTAEGLREPIFYGGDSAYHFQYEELAQSKYKADNDWLELHVGFTIGEACLVAQAFGKLHLQKFIYLRESMKARPPDQWTFLPAFLFDTQELQALTGIEIKKIERIVSAFCIDPDTANASFSSLSAFNEINAAPIIKLSAGPYLLFQMYSFLEALYETPFFWMNRDKSYNATASKNRGAFAENFVADRLSRVFGPQHVFRNVDIYKGKDRFTEADVLVLYGDQALIVQTKSKRLTIEARKGNDLQLKEDFKKAIHEAYEQALSCSKSLLSNEYKLTLPTGDEINISRIPRKIFPLCIVSDHYPALAAQARQFLEIHASEAIQPPIITDVFFMDVLTEILESPLHFFNYLALRARFDKQLIVNQELTILGYHLKHNLWLEDNYDMVNLGDDFTSSLDIAMHTRRAGVPGERTPKGILTRFEGSPIGRLLSEIEANATPELVGLGMLFLQFSSDAAKHINAGIDGLVQSAAKDGKQHDLSVRSETDESGFTLHVNSLPEELARERLSIHCRLRKYDTKSDVWYGILLSPGNGRIRGALVIEQKWRVDPNMEEALKAWPRKPSVPLTALLPRRRKQKLGRNEPCPCGSGKRYKKCCLNQ
ncbi:MAG: SEC-C domain-containing protein [Rhodoplanes sp.]|uniref:NERD domain-containing protein n=1 Tax=Rhodoplanes sp. TaxID=1968906 RepID=UPI0017D4FF62|nr:SEC-C metal-binding domain-containing protein [Rhodoplanes sp.]NVO14930.1 SEC-C domain-containing protein [Rhodoplanes sp.]